MDSVDDHPDGWGFPIRISPDQSMLATPRSFSQPTTSFIASQCQGIRQTPLLCLISQLFVSEGRSHDRPSARSVQGTTPTTKTALFLPFPTAPPRRRSAESRLQTSSDERCQRTIRCDLHRVSCTCVMVVEADGIEPTTSCLQSRRSPN
jgi:hypothetical protein